MTKSKLLAVFLVLAMGIFTHPEASLAVGPNIQTSDSGATELTLTDGNKTVTIVPSGTVSWDGKYSLSTYSQFSIAADEKAVVLLHSDIKYSIHRIDNNANPMNIFGTLESRKMQGVDFTNITGPIYGHLILISPAGIHIGPNAKINTGSLMMTTSSVTNLKDSSNSNVDINSISPSVFMTKSFNNLETSVIEFAGISNSIVVNSSIDGAGNLKRVIIKTATPASGEKATIDFIAGSIINEGIIGDSDIVNFQTNNVNLIAANNVTKNSDNTFQINGASSGHQGSVYLSPTSVVQANNITIKASGSNPTSPGTNGNLNNTAINVEGKVNAYVLNSNSGKITLQGGSAGVTSGNKIYINHVDGTTEKLTANGSDALITINTPELWYKNSSPDALVISQGTKSINALVTIIDPPPVIPPPPPPPTPPTPSVSVSNEIQATVQVIKPQVQTINPTNSVTGSPIITGNSVTPISQPTTSNPVVAQADSTNNSGSTLGFDSGAGAENTDSTNTQTQDSSSNNQQTNQETQANNKQETSSKEEVPQETTITINQQKVDDFYGDLFLKAMFERNSKESEYNADLNAVRVTSMLNYHPAAMAGFLMKVRRLERESSGSNKVNTVFIYRHPETIGRLVKVRNQIADITFDNGIADTINQQRFQNAVFTLRK